LLENENDQAQNTGFVTISSWFHFVPAGVAFRVFLKAIRRRTDVVQGPHVVSYIKVLRKALRVLNAIRGQLGMAFSEI
jgi:hypothetical protein